ncbi:hypothetical protein DFH28DRAFT_880962 [Melampsora americana]|nr:hypothetical protein DFH28DRAFT_880962 [Melampsora americana]
MSPPHLSWANLPYRIMSRIFSFLPNWYNRVHRVLLTRVNKHWYNGGIYECWRYIEIVGVVNVIKLNIIALARPDLAVMTRTIDIYKVKWWDFSESYWKTLPLEEKGFAADFVWPGFYGFEWIPNASAFLL